jgi:hypothetical protein
VLPVLQTVPGLIGLLTHRLRRMIARSFSSLPAISRSAPRKVGR